MLPHKRVHDSSSGTQRSRLRWRVVAVLTLSAFAFLLTAIAPAGAQSSTATTRDHRVADHRPADADTPIGAVVWELTGPHPDRAVALLPPGFVHSMGYRPQLVAGVPVNPHGGCSSPVRLPRRFEELCRSHDFGYDLLRFANRTGHPLGGWARRSLDRMLIDRMRASCTNPICTGAAEIARIGLAANTWRQDDGPPVDHESTLRVATTAVRHSLDAVGSIR